MEGGEGGEGAALFDKGGDLGCGPADKNIETGTWMNRILFGR
jgi:hypothetical protein